MMNLILYYLIMATFVPIAISQGLFDFINHYYGSCASSCASQAYSWQEGSSCIDSRPCWCSVNDAAFFEKLVCCIYQSDDCSVDVDVINQGLEEWCSRETGIKTPHQTNFRDPPPLPSTCAAPVRYTPSQESELIRRSYYRSGSNNESFSGGKVAGIIVLAVVVTLGLAIGIMSAGNRAAKRTSPTPPPLPMHTTRRLTTVPPQNSPRRPPTAIVRRGTPPPPPPYSAKDEPTPRYEASNLASR